jgi:single-strand DNA-binding protein
MNNLSNSVRLTGRLGAAPEMKEFDDDKKVAKISWPRTILLPEKR